MPSWQRRELPRIERPMRVAMIGAGKYAQHHMSVIRAIENVEIHAICTRGSQSSIDTANRFGISRHYTSMDQLIADDAIDAYFVVVPVPEIKRVAMESISTGRPVFLEKPPGLSSDDTRDLICCANDHKTFGMVGYNRRYYSVLEHGLAALSGYGRIQGVALEVPETIYDKRSKASSSDHAIFQNYTIAQTSHALDLMSYLLGDLKEVRSIAEAHSLYTDCPGSFSAALRYTGGWATILSIQDCYTRWRMRIVAQNAVLELENLERGFLQSRPLERVPVPVDSIDHRFRAGLYAQDHHFLHCVSNQVRPANPACLLEDSLATQSLVESLWARDEVGG